MSAQRKFVAIATSLAMLAASTSGVAAEKRIHHHRLVYKAHHTMRYAGDSGWRHRNNARGWDHSCIDVPWLSNMEACSAR